MSSKSSQYGVGSVMPHRNGSLRDRINRDATQTRIRPESKPYSSFRTPRGFCRSFFGSLPPLLSSAIFSFTAGTSGLPG